ncbi:MAG: PLDc N-terminal domain-containing protein [Corynebacterium sp.]|nr:PLDc N-terminal domain-containing protein [Corynebacterium sp.]
MNTTCRRKSRCNTVRWNELTDFERKTILGFVGADVVGKLAAWHLLYHRPSEHFRGPKWFWFLTSLINGFGPLAFFAFGRK